MPGPKKKPIETARRDGSLKKNKARYLSKTPDTAPALDECPQPPEWLPELARKYWRELAPIAYEMGLLKSADVQAFADLCYWHSIRDEAVAVLELEGQTVTDNRGTISRHPIAIALNQAADKLVKLRACFGFTPADRAGKLTQEKKEEEQDPIARYREGASGE